VQGFTDLTPKTACFSAVSRYNLYMERISKKSFDADE
jgi:hypothetical protein